MQRRGLSEPLPQASGPPITLGEDEGDRAEGKTVKVKRTREEGTTPVTPTDQAEKYKAMVAAMTAEVDQKNEETGNKAKVTGPKGGRTIEETDTGAETRSSRNHYDGYDEGNLKK